MRRLAVMVMLLVGCAGTQRPDRVKEPLELTYLGTAGWLVRAAGKTILVDPYFSRLRFHEKSFEGDERHVYDQQEPVSPDDAAIARYAPEKADLILVAHSHFDHVMDVPAVALRTGASILGTASTANLARASGVPDEQLIQVLGGEDYAFDGFSVKVMPGLHSALDGKHWAFGVLIPPSVRVPLSLGDYGDGGSLAFLVRIAGHEILFINSANYIEREMAGLRPDVAIVAPGLREEIYDYTCRLMDATGHPPLLIPTHFDNQELPLDRAESDWPRLEEKLKDFVAEVKDCSPDTAVRIPRQFQPIKL